MGSCGYSWVVWDLRLSIFSLFDNEEVVSVKGHFVFWSLANPGEDSSSNSSSSSSSSVTQTVEGGGGDRSLRWGGRCWGFKYAHWSNQGSESWCESPHNFLIIVYVVFRARRLVELWPFMQCFWAYLLLYSFTICQVCVWFRGGCFWYVEKGYVVACGAGGGGTRGRNRRCWQSASVGLFSYKILLKTIHFCFPSLPFNSLTKLCQLAVSEKKVDVEHSLKNIIIPLLNSRYKKRLQKITLCCRM